jgi:hypothetical protein
LKKKRKREERHTHTHKKKRKELIKKEKKNALSSAQGNSKAAQAAH